MSLHRDDSIYNTNEARKGIRWPFFHIKRSNINKIRFTCFKSSIWSVFIYFYHYSQDNEQFRYPPWFSHVPWQSDIPSILPLQAPWFVYCHYGLVSIFFLILYKKCHTVYTHFLPCCFHSAGLWDLFMLLCISIMYSFLQLSGEQYVVCPL